MTSKDYPPSHEVTFRIIAHCKLRKPSHQLLGFIQQDFQSILTRPLPKSIWGLTELRFTYRYPNWMKKRKKFIRFDDALEIEIIAHARVMNDKNPEQTVLDWVVGSLRTVFPTQWRSDVEILELIVRIDMYQDYMRTSYVRGHYGMHKFEVNLLQQSKRKQRWRILKKRYRVRTTGK